MRGFSIAFAVETMERIHMRELLAGKKGVLYGTTAFGGKGDHGVVFKLTPTGMRHSEILLHEFRTAGDGANPYAGLIADATGALYGTTLSGGISPCYGTLSGCGTVFELTP